jgi:hypothetical protein
MNKKKIIDKLIYSYPTTKYPDAKDKYAIGYSPNNTLTMMYDINATPLKPIELVNVPEQPATDVPEETKQKLLAIWEKKQANAQNTNEAKTNASAVLAKQENIDQVVEPTKSLLEEAAAVPLPPDDDDLNKQPEVTPESITVDTKQGLQSVIKTVVDTILENKEIEEQKNAAEIAAAELAAKEAKEAADKLAAEEAARQKAEQERIQKEQDDARRAQLQAAETEAKRLAKENLDRLDAEAVAKAAEVERLRLEEEEKQRNNIIKLETTIQLKIEKNSIHIFSNINFNITNTSETKGIEFATEDLKTTIENVITPAKQTASGILSPYHDVYYGKTSTASTPIQIKFFIYFTSDNKLYFYLPNIMTLNTLPTTTSVSIKKGEDYTLNITSNDEPLLQKINDALKVKNATLGGKTRRKHKKTKKTIKRKHRRTKKHSHRKTRR